MANPNIAIPNNFSSKRDDTGPPIIPKNEPGSGGRGSGGRGSGGRSSGDFHISVRSTNSIEIISGGRRYPKMVFVQGLSC
ncbi:hypothetical protein EJ03DRAFT_330567 [Teratosphaeria nubilosa]|uniref:Uncharacterized protein n=1 Tax=Teratosphaeria nubilosa TaxID=161662 RepID=A0A6G1KZ14_9PEZI|nr:hypothetical protein EJ03DRAFT_330567 [Teratosphaeria nubilosa]